MAEVHKPLGNTQLLEDPRRALLNRVAASEPFANSPRLRKLLLYLAECALREPQLPQTEQQVGVAVFNRSAGYDTSADAIVRVQMSEIRKRLKYYFLSEGIHEPLMMELPRGSYLPVFTPREPRENVPARDTPHSNGSTKALVVETTALERLSEEKKVSDQVARGQLVALFVLASLLGVAVVLCAWLAFQNARLRNTPAESTPFLKHFWKQFFQNGRQTDIVLGDVGLVAVEDTLGRYVSLQEYSSPDYPAALLAPFVKGPRAERYINGMVRRGVVAPNDTAVLHELSLFSERYQIPFKVVTTREARIDPDPLDNVILLGHRRNNPWVEPFESRMNFQHRYDDATRTATIVNISPLPGEKSSYVTKDRNQAYAVVACLPGTGKRGNVLILSAIHLSRIYGAAQLVTDETTMAKLHALLGIGPSDPMPYFEALLEKTQNTPKFEIIAHRVIKTQ